MTALRALKPRVGTAKREPFAGFVCDGDTQAALQRAAAGQGWPESAVRGGGIAEALAELPGIPTPELLVIDISQSPDPVTETSNLAAVCDENTHVIILGAVNDIRLFRALVDIGADDYLLKPVSPEILSEAVTRVLTPAAAAETDDGGEGRIVTVVGARGGSGATSVAVNSAWLAAEDLGLKTALVDLDLHFGTVALSLDIEPGRGFGEALESPNRIDALFLERAMVRVGKNLSVLGSERMLENTPHLSASAIDPLVERLRSDFRGAIFDLPRAMVTATPQLLAVSNSVVLVSDLSLAGMRDSLRLSEFIRAKAPTADLRVVVNRTDGKTKNGEMKPEEFERNAELKIAAVLPDDVKSAAKAAGTGKPLAAVAPKGRFASALRGFVPEMLGIAPARKASLWQRMSRRGG